MKLNEKLENLVFYGVLIGGGLALLYVARNGIAGTARDLTSGLVKGTIDAAAGVLAGAYTAIPAQVRPDSDQNVIYQGASAIARKLPGADDSDTLGTWLYNITHPNEKF